MIAATLAILSLCAWAAAFFGSAFRFVENGITDAIAWICAAFCVLSLAYVLTLLVEYESNNPCAQYETRLQYNPATKTMLPMRVCVLRGEWVTDEAVNNG